MTVDRRRPPLGVPYRVEVRDRIPKERATKTGLSFDQLAAALRAVDVSPLERPVVDLGF
jgi:hypothetical protein